MNWWHRKKVRWQPPEPPEDDVVSKAEERLAATEAEEPSIELLLRTSRKRQHDYMSEILRRTFERPV